jgi:putative SOS response-associated peptidase YedK
VCNLYSLTKGQAANLIVAPIHPKAMPVILTTTEEFDLWLEGETVESRWSKSVFAGLRSAQC